MFGRDIDLHFHAVADLGSDGVARAHEEGPLGNVGGGIDGEAEDVLRGIAAAKAVSGQRAVLGIAQDVASEPVLGQADVPPVVRVHHHERRRKFLRPGDLLDGATDDIDLVPARGGMQEADGERRGLRDQAVEIFPHVVAREQLQFFGEVHIVRHHRADESHQFAEVVENLTRCGNPGGDGLDSLAHRGERGLVLRFGAGFRHGRGRGHRLKHLNEIDHLEGGRVGREQIPDGQLLARFHGDAGQATDLQHPGDGGTDRSVRDGGLPLE